jgi:predicted N-acyltransferase
MVTLAHRLGASSVHVNFPGEEEWRRLSALGFLPRVGQQFHWLNKGYANFDDFLADLASRKRKAIRKERQAVAAYGLDIRALVGRDITEGHWDAFYDFYKATTDRKWGPGYYLTREFFSLLSERLGPSVVLVFARDAAGRPVAGALNLQGGGVLYGRNWGASRRYEFLHFEACYYQAIEYAITHGLARVEAGAQGPHKVQRGYLPVQTYSAHWIADSGFRAAVERFLKGERRETEWEMREHVRHSPFRRPQQVEDKEETGDS